MSAVDNEELAARIADLERGLRDLQADLAKEHSRSLRPPRPTEILRLTDQHAIPIAIAFLEAHIHALKLLQGIIRAVTVSGEVSTKADSQIEQLSRTVVDRLDAVVEDLRSTPLPEQPEARELLEDARSLRDELTDQLDENSESVTAHSTSEIDIDVDAELDEIRSDVLGDDEDNHSTGEN